MRIDLRIFNISQPEGAAAMVKLNFQWPHVSQKQNIISLEDLWSGYFESCSLLYIPNNSHNKDYFEIVSHCPVVSHVKETDR